MATPRCSVCKRRLPAMPGGAESGMAVTIAHVEPYRSPPSPNGFAQPCTDRMNGFDYTRRLVEELAQRDGLTVPEWQRANLATAEL